MEDPLRRRTAISLLAGAAIGVSGCVQSGDDGNGTQGDSDGDDSDGDQDGDDQGPDDESGDDDGDDSGNDDGDGDSDGDGDGDVSPPDDAAVERATIDYGETIGPMSDWYASGGSYVATNQEQALSESGALEVELFSSTYATAGYDFPEPFSVEDRHLSLAIKVESPTGGLAELRLRESDSDKRIACARRLPPDMSDWMRIDLGITQGQNSPDLNNLETLRFHVAGSEETDIKYWIDDVRVTESTAESSAILAFYGARMSHYETVFPMLEDRGWQAAVAVPPTGIGADGRMGLDELRELRDAGWDICSYPTRGGTLPDLDREEQRSVIESEQDRLVSLGFETGARHFFAPQHRMNGDTIDIVQDLHETGFLYGGNSAGMPPTAPHTLPVIDGSDFDSSRSAVLRADIHNQLVTLAFDEIGADGASEDDLEAQFDRLEDNDYGDGLNVITPSELADEYL